MFLDHSGSSFTKGGSSLIQECDQWYETSGNPGVQDWHTKKRGRNELGGICQSRCPLVSVQISKSTNKVKIVWDIQRPRRNSINNLLHLGHSKKCCKATQIFKQSFLASGAFIRSCHPNSKRFFRGQLKKPMD